MIDPLLAQEIKSIIHKNGVTDKEFARIMNLKPSDLEDIVSGKKHPDEVFFKRLSDLFRVKLNKVFKQ